MENKLHAIKREIEQIQQANNAQAIEQFFHRHRILLVGCYLYMGVRWVLLACLWTIALLLAVVGLKVLWLAVLYMWRLI